jgi:hypothetical protein
LNRGAGVTNRNRFQQRVGYLAADRRSVTLARATLGSSASFGLVEMRRL